MSRNNGGSQSSESTSNMQDLIRSSEIIDEEPELTTDIEQTNMSEKGFFDRLYMKVTLGEKIPSILMLSISSFTSTFLCLPWMVSQLGLILSFLFLLLFFFINGFTMHLLGKLVDKSNVGNSYYEMISIKLSAKFGVIFEAANFIYLLSSVMIMDYFSYKFCLQIFGLFAKDDENDWVISVLILALLFVCQGWMMFFYDNKFIFVSFLQCFCICALSVAMLVKIFVDLSNIRNNNKEMIKFETKAVYCFPLLVLIFNNHNDYFLFFKNMKMRTYKRVSAVISWAYLIIFSFAFFFTVIGYFFHLSFPEVATQSISSIISFHFPASIDFKKSAVFYSIVAINFIMIFSMQFFVCYKINKFNEELRVIIKPKTSYPKTLPIISKLSPTFISLLPIPFIRNIITLIGICGSLGSTIPVVILPLLAFTVRAVKNPSLIMVNYAIILIFFVLCLMCFVFVLIQSWKIEED